MPRIRVLDDHLVNRIAAGEVVERPASVVKELVENSLDAGAGSIAVTLEDGGRRRILVVDDGSGMERDDALLALERHATSKLTRFEDLEAIATLGFRGEALPSIAAVSRFRLRTAARDGAGTEIEVSAGRLAAVREIGGPPGTSVEVAALFFNVPARRKFLRAGPTELSHAVRCVSHYALAHPAVRFRLDHEGRRILDAPPASGLAERLAQVHGRDLAAKLLPFERTERGIAVRGFAGRPVDATGRRDVQHLFVNGRLVADRVLSHAVAAAYGNTLARGLHPAVLLFVDLDPAEVDVNVHPQKTEVRFRRSGEIHDVVREAVASALSREGAIPTLADLRPAAAAGAAPPAAPAPSARGFAEPAPAWSPPPAPAAATLLEPGSPAVERGRTASPLAQYRDSYIVAQDAEGILIVDQHVAHERVLFERYLADAERDAVEVQRLLFPLTIDLPPGEAVLAASESAELRRLGFAVEAFGGNTVRLDAVPALAREVPPERLLRAVLGEAARTPSAPAGIEELRRRFVTTAACQAAIKVNYPLSREAMQRLLDDLFETRNPTTCPHGRPIVFRLTLAEIERAFRRR